MTAELFSVRCTTCQRVLKVRSAAAVGQILACPKCGSMVHVVPPPDWSPALDEQAAAVGDGEIPTSAVSAMAASSPAESREPASVADEQPPVPPWLSPVEAALRKWTLYAGLPIASAIAVWAFASFLFSPDVNQELADEAARIAVRPDAAQPATEPDTDIAAAPESDDPARDEANEPSQAPPVVAPEDSVPAPQDGPVLDDPLSDPPSVGDFIELLPPLAESDGNQRDVESPHAPPEPSAEAPGPRATTPLSPTIDVEARLADRLMAVDQPKITLADLVDLLSALSTIPMTFDLDAMSEAGVHPEDEVSVKMTDASIGEVLVAALEPLGLEPAIEHNQLLITTSTRQTVSVRTVRYRVDDLAGGDTDATAGLAEMIRRLVQPTTWNAVGGPGEIKSDGDSLVVTHNESAQQEILVLCEKMRAARGRPLRSGRDPAGFALTTRYAKARKALETTVTANFYRARPLEEIVDHFQNATAVNISVNWLALRREGISPEVETSVVVAGQPLAGALDQLLRPLGLTYRIVDARWLFITTLGAAGEKPVLEFYQVRPLVKDDPTAAFLLDDVTRQIAPNSWRHTDGHGNAYYDAPSGYLLVLQTQAAHIELEEYLTTLRGETP